MADRVGRYWLADEGVLYIGLASRPLRTRVREYYNTPVGASKPHKGGWWLKLLSVLEACHVHVAATADFKKAEEDMLRVFAAGVSDLSKARLPPGEPVMPFANLRDGDWRRREHGLRNETTAPKRTSRHVRTSISRRAPTPARAPTRGVAAIDDRVDNRSQRVTAKDIAAGQVRVPRVAKALLPEHRQDVAVILRGRALTCRWDPRYGPPERSGVIRIGKQAAAELLAVDDKLAVSVSPDGTVSLD